MSRTSRVKLTEYDNGKMLIERYEDGDQKPRYTPMHHTDHGELTNTKENYRILLKFRRKDGPLKAVQLLLRESKEIANYLIKLYIEKGDEHDGK